MHYEKCIEKYENQPSQNCVIASIRLESQSVVYLKSYFSFNKTHIYTCYSIFKDTIYFQVVVCLTFSYYSCFIIFPMVTLTPLVLVQKSNFIPKMSCTSFTIQYDDFIVAFHHISIHFQNVPGDI